MQGAAFGHSADRALMITSIIMQLGSIRMSMSMGICMCICMGLGMSMGIGMGMSMCMSRGMSWACALS